MVFDPLQYFFLIRTRKNPFRFSDSRSRLQSAPLQFVDVHVFELPSLPELFPNFLRRFGNHRMRQDGDNPERFRSDVKHLLEPYFLRRVLRKCPRLLFREIFVGYRDQTPNYR